MRRYDPGDHYHALLARLEAAIKDEGFRLRHSQSDGALYLEKRMKQKGEFGTPWTVVGGPFRTHREVAAHLRVDASSEERLEREKSEARHRDQQAEQKAMAAARRKGGLW
ncbi:MAG: hypothetical protein ACRDUY_08175 [Nitriliruptorales bacterium]